MADPEGVRGGSAYSSRAMAAIMVILVVGISLVTSLGSLDIAGRELQDTDGYMRYARVVDLVTGENGWFDGGVHWSNSPFGHSMHWTRPLDAVVAGLAAPLAPFSGWEDAVYWAGLVSGPLLHLALAFAVAWAARPFMPAAATYLAGTVAGLQPTVIGYTSVGRLDHHVLIAALAVVLAGSAIRLLVGRPEAAERFPAAPLGGLAAAVGLWVSTESLLPVGMVIGAFGVDWVLRGPARARPGSLWATWFAVGTLAATAIELGPGDLGAVEYDRISLPYVVAAGVLATGWWLIRSLPAPFVSSAARRALVAAVVTGAAVLVVGLAFRGILGGPFADVPSELHEVWLDHVQESQPMWDSEAPVTVVLFRLGAAFVAIPLAVVLGRRARGSPVAPGWWFVAAWLVVTTAVSLRSTRFALYPEAMAALPLAAGAWIVLERTSRALIRVGVLVAVVVGYLVPVMLVAAIDRPRGEEVSTCDLAELASAIDAASAAMPTGASSDGPPTVLAHVDLGPELHVRAGVEIVATPHHRDVDGILDARAIMLAPPDAARAMVEARSIDLVVVCPERDREYLAPIPDDSLAALLLAGDLPSWLRAVPENAALSDLYAVVPLPGL